MGRKRSDDEAKLHGYGLRISVCEGVDHGSVRDFCGGLGLSYAACYEEPDREVSNPHYHIHFRRTTEQVVKHALLKRWPHLKPDGKGGKILYSLAPVRKEENYDWYIWKGRDPGSLSDKADVVMAPTIIGYWGVEYTPDYVLSLYGKWDWDKDADHAST